MKYKKTADLVYIDIISAPAKFGTSRVSRNVVKGCLQNEHYESRFLETNWDKSGTSILRCIHELRSLTMVLFGWYE